MGITGRHRRVTSADSTDDSHAAGDTTATTDAITRRSAGMPGEAQIVVDPGC
jgi:hypothetical protein